MSKVKTISVKELTKKILNKGNLKDGGSIYQFVRKWKSVLTDVLYDKVIIPLSIMFI